MSLTLRGNKIQVSVVDRAVKIVFLSLHDSVILQQQVTYYNTGTAMRPQKLLPQEIILGLTEPLAFGKTCVYYPSLLPLKATK